VVCTEDSSKENCFEIVTKERVWRLAANSQKEMKDWLEALRPSGTHFQENDEIFQLEQSIHKYQYAAAIALEEKWRKSKQQPQQPQQPQSPLPSPKRDTTEVSSQFKIGF